MKETKTKLYLNKVFVLTRVKSDEESDGGGVDGNQADEDVGQEEPDQHQQTGDWVVCEHYLVKIYPSEGVLHNLYLFRCDNLGDAPQASINPL